MAPSPRSTSAISGTSRMSGQLVIVLVPSASSAAAISFNTLFLAPPTATSPDNRLPPVTTNRSLTRVSVNSASASVSFPSLRATARYGFTMAVHLTRIYTRTGDDGTTGLSDFSRVSKNDARLAAYADCDETNAAIGVAVALGNPDEQILDVLRQIQNDLFDAGADLSTPVVENPEHPPLRITQSYIDRLGVVVRRVQRAAAGAEFVCAAGRYAAVGAAARRPDGGAPGRAVGVARGGGARRTVSVLPAKYLNRLSDLLFILSRVANPDGDVLWQPGGRAKPTD